MTEVTEHARTGSLQPSTLKKSLNPDCWEDIHSKELHCILFSPIGEVMMTRTEDSGMFSYFIYVTDARTPFPNGDCPLKNMMRYSTQGSVLRL